VQTKLEMFFRILSAKLNALQDMDRISFSILNYFNEPQAFCNKQDFKDTCKASA
jgi:hypothetical protein